jgi:ribosomal protein L11 methyltransferase
MHSLHLTCKPEQAEAVACALWEAGTVGIREEERDGNVALIAGFADEIDRDWLSAEFIWYQPQWEQEADIDWVVATQQAWPARQVGERIFLAPVWNTVATPDGRVRVIHNPGSASGTGEHPCTQLALESLEKCVRKDYVVVDVGTGSGILSVAALKLGARAAVGLDTDLEALRTARENHDLNHLCARLAAGSVDCIAPEVADVVVANISGTVLLSIADELLGMLRPEGWLILTGFPESELAVLQAAFGKGEASGMNEWRCLIVGFGLPFGGHNL